jgi:hypothetical protein
LALLPRILKTLYVRAVKGGMEKNEINENDQITLTKPFLDGVIYSRKSIISFFFSLIGQKCQMDL